MIFVCFAPRFAPEIVRYVESDSGCFPVPNPPPNPDPVVWPSCHGSGADLGGSGVRFGLVTVRYRDKSKSRRLRRRVLG